MNNEYIKSKNISWLEPIWLFTIDKTVIYILSNFILNKVKTIYLSKIRFIKALAPHQIFPQIKR
jgi:Na+-translocating ferredoxin:NAD+ oxidoreductase RnfA subunit